MRWLPANGDGDSVNHESGEQLGVRERASHFCLCRSMIICLCELEKRKLKATAKRLVDCSSMEKPFAAANESFLSLFLEGYLSCYEEIVMRESHRRLRS